MLGGTFDPIHLGHLRAAENARDRLLLDEVAFVPSGQPPHRQTPMSSALDRFTMVALATAGNERFRPLDLEIGRPGPHFTVDTVEALLATGPSSLHLIVGSDTFVEMTGWREAARIFALCHVAVVPRPGVPETEAPKAPFADARGVEVVTGPALAISASEVRACARAGRSVRYLVPETVAGYIAKRGLYS
jgi:nicotinate-nucleotide adenylyltransferase